MALQHITKVFAVTDAKIAALTSDVAGDEPVYGALIDVPGIKSVTISGTVETKTLRGDNQLLDADSVLTDIKIEFEGAKLSLDVIAASLSATVVDSGVTPNQVATLDITNTAKPSPFKFVAKSATADVIGGDVMLTLWKVVLSSFPELGLAEEDYKTSPNSGTAMPLLSTGKWVSVAIRETAAALA